MLSASPIAPGPSSGGRATVIGAAIVAVVVIVGGVVVLNRSSDAPSPPPGTSAATKRAQDREAQSNLRNALTAEKTFYTDEQRYTERASDLAAIEPSASYREGTADDDSPADDLYIAVASRSQVVCLSTRSRSGELFMIKDVALGNLTGISYGRGSIPDRCDAEPLSTSWEQGAPPAVPSGTRDTLPAPPTRPPSADPPRAGRSTTSCNDTVGMVAGKPQFAGAPVMGIDLSKTYTATIETTKGQIVIALSPPTAPNAVNSFVFLARCGFYDNTTIHRVAKDFVIQGGDPTGTGAGGPGYRLPDELPKQPGYAVGDVAMANSGANTAGSQFFVVTGEKASSLPTNYTLFGRVTSGIEVAEQIEQVASEPPEDGRPLEQIVVSKVTITEQ